MHTLVIGEKSCSKTHFFEKTQKTHFQKNKHPFFRKKEKKTAGIPLGFGEGGQGAGPGPNVNGRGQGAGPGPNVNGRGQGAGPGPNVNGRGQGAGPGPRLNKIGPIWSKYIKIGAIWFQKWSRKWLRKVDVFSPKI